MNFTKDISKAIKVMHEKGYSHCDIKPLNVLLEYDHEEHRIVCILIDFGITVPVTSKTLVVKAFEIMKSKGISVAYAAPEALSQYRGDMHLEGIWNLKFDVYSLAMTLYELLNGIEGWN